MSIMAEPKRPKKPKGASGGKPSPRSGKPLHIWIDEDLRAAVDRLLEQTRRSLTAEVSIALEKHLKEHGLWPPPTKDS